MIGHAQQVYEGSEAAALRCSNTLALTAVALSRAEMIGAADKEVMLGVSIGILDKHVSGTWAQKKAALRIMRDRRTPEATIEDYRRNAARCFKQFPIN
jgi:UDP-N-acetylmuramyl tripeptide synthase